MEVASSCFALPLQSQELPSKAKSNNIIFHKIRIVKNEKVEAEITG